MNHLDNLGDFDIFDNIDVLDDFGEYDDFDDGVILATDYGFIIIIISLVLMI